MQDLLEQMARRVLRHTDEARAATAIPRVWIGALWPGSVPTVTTSAPGVCLVLQGSKQMLVGERMLRYGAGSCFASLLELPATRLMYQIDGTAPYVAAALTFDHDALNALMIDIPAAPSNKTVAGFNVATVSRELLEAWDHHLALLDQPNDIAVLAASREREVLYRLLQSPHGPLLRQLARADGQLTQVRRAMEWIRQHYAEPLPIKRLAEIASMSVPTFNRNFRVATSTSPLQYQKTLRLQAARRLLAKSADAARTAYAVGYESPSQFSREYSRMYGRSPKLDASLIRESLGEAPSVLI